MASKWATFRKLYPKAPIEATAFDAMNAVLDAPAYPVEVEGDLNLITADTTRVRDLNNTQLKGLYVQVRQAIDELDAKISVLNVQKNALTYLFTERFEEDDVTSMKFDDGVMLSEAPEPYPNVKDRATLVAWIKSTGQEDLLTLNFQTLASMCKQLLLDGKPIPPGVDIYMKSKLSARGIKTTQGESQ